MASLKSTSEGQTLILTISNPEFKNALSPEIYAAGIEALNAAENSSDIRSVIITGEGSQFCAGGNLNRLLERISAQRLHDFGLVNQLSHAGSALTDALTLAERLNARAPNTLASIKELINDAPGNTLSQQLASERDHFVKNLHHANGGEGIDAFLQKRTPHYR